MAGIVIDTVFTNTALPVGESLAAGVLASDNLQHWFQADGAHVDLTGDTIDNWIDRKGSGRVLAPVAGSATLDDAALGAFPAALFDDASSDHYALSGSTLPWSGAFTIAAVARLDDLASGLRMLVGAGSGSTFYLGRIDTQTMRLRCGGTNNINAVFPNTTDWFSVIASYDGTSVGKVSINGAAAISGAASDPSVSSATVLGATASSGTGFWSGHISDLMIWNIDLLASGAAAERARVEAFFASAYGIGA
jgi:hypothetical protein